MFLTNQYNKKMKLKKKKYILKNRKISNYLLILGNCDIHECYTIYHLFESLIPVELMVVKWYLIGSLPQIVEFI